MEIMVRTRKKRYSGGPAQQDLDRNRPEDLPAPDQGKDNGQEQPHAQSESPTPSGSDQTQTLSQTGLPENREVMSITIQRRQQWTQEQYKEVMWCYYYAIASKDKDGVIKATYTIWRQRNPDIFQNINSNTLANQRRYIMKRNKVADIELEEIKTQVTELFERTETPDELREFPINTLNEVQPMNLVPPINQPTYLVPENNDVIDMESKILQALTTIQAYSISQRKKLQKVYTTYSTQRNIKLANMALSKIKQNKKLDLTNINELMYAAAYVIAGEVKKNTESRPKRDNNEPAWKVRLEKHIERFRSELAIIREYKKGVTTAQVHKKIRIIKKKYRMYGCIVEIEQNIVMKMQAKAQRLRRYTKRRDQYYQNKLFREDAKRFYRHLNSKRTEIKESPTQQQIENFWGNILENQVIHNQRAPWIQKEQQDYENVPNGTWRDFTVDEITQIIRRTHGWKSPGPDKLQNFWLKQFTVLHVDLTEALNETVKNPANIPLWLTTGTTYLLSKGKDTREPKNYRPITCLPTFYKVLTAAISNRIYDHLIKNKIFPDEQKGCRKSSRGCKDQLLISKMVTGIAKRRMRSLGLAWIDYKKAFDSVPHSWINTTMRTYRISPTITQFVEQAMEIWRTEMMLFHANGIIQTKTINIKRGIFQGDSLSPLLFCLALIPLTNMLNRQNVGVKIDESTDINHLFYMDDLKLFARDENQLQRALGVVKEFSDDIKMEFGLDKCATAIYKRGKLIKSQNIMLDAKTVIRNLDVTESYKYLGFEEKDGIDNGRMKKTVATEYYRRVRQVLNTELNAKNKITAINTLAVPIMTYSFGIVDWLREEIKNIDRKTRKLLTIGGIHHPRADVCRIYIKRRNGGRGLIELESAYNSTITGLSDYIASGKDRFCKAVSIYDLSKAKYSLQKECESIKSKYFGNEPGTRKDQERLKNNIENERIELLKAKPLHGQFYRNLDKTFVDKGKSMGWLRSSGLKGETESLIIAAQDQALRTRYFQKKILKQNVNSKCRMCNAAEEHISHIIAGCSTLAPSEYTHRHNKVAAYLHWTICRDIGMQVSNKYYEHLPEKVIKYNDVIIMWDYPIITDRTILANRPDIVLHDKKQNMCLLIDVSIPDDSNVALKETEKISKYKDLELEISRMWNTRTKTVPIVLGALGTIKKGLEHYLQLIPGQPTLYEVQKIALLGTAHILRKVLS